MDAGAKEIPYHGGKSCLTCNDGVTLSFVLANGRQGLRPSIPAWCLKGHFLENLPVDKYGEHFGLSRSRTSKRPSDYRLDQRRRFEILERDGFTCVYCREPASTTEIEQIGEVLVSPVSSLVNADRGPTIFKVGELEVKTFFGHDADHLFTESDRALLDRHIDREIDSRICQRWVVTACPACNNGRKGRDMPYRTLMSVYARHLFEVSGEPDWEDLDRFCTALKLLRHLRVIAAKQMG